MIYTYISVCCDRGLGSRHLNPEGTWGGWVGGRGERQEGVRLGTEILLFFYFQLYLTNFLPSFFPHLCNYDKALVVTAVH